MSGAPAGRLSVIVPFLDEQASLERAAVELVPAIAALGLDWELVLVDDGSRDGSLAPARRLAALAPAAAVIVHPVNCGLGAAIRSGLAAATGTLVLTLDADLTFHPRDAALLLARLGEEDAPDAVLGSPALARFDRVPWWRVALSRGANLAYQLALGRRLTAITSIFRLYRRAALQGLVLESEGFDINAEVLARLVLAGARIAEVPVALGVRADGESKLRHGREIARHLRLLWRILGWRAAAWRRPR